MGKIGIIDADLIGRKKHRFPNLACMKISSYYKRKDHVVKLLLNYDSIDEYDRVVISKVFTDTLVPKRILEKQNVRYGGTGFFYENAVSLPHRIEHCMPDYTLYNEFVGQQINNGFRKEGFKYYTDYDIGFMTRGCFRKCPFCVNQKYDHVFMNSTLKEFQTDRKKICLLDDNIFGYKEWEKVFEELNNTGKRFQFKQGLDERLLTSRKCRVLFNSNYDGDYIFAFDNIEDYDLINKKLELIRKYTDSKAIKFYVLCGFVSTDHIDIANIFKRIELLMKYKCLAYIMRYQNKNDCPWKRSEYAGMYVTIARWCNQPNFYRKMSFREFCEANQNVSKSIKLCSSMKAMVKFEREHPKIAERYFDMKY